MKPAHSPVSLQLKLTVGLVLIVMAPLGVAAYFLGDLGKAAANVAAGEASARIHVLEKSIDTYHEMINTTKRLHGEVAGRLAHRPDLLAFDPELGVAKLVDVVGLDVTGELSKLLAEPAQAGMSGIAILRADGTVFAEAERPLAGPTWRAKVVDEPIGDSGATLRLTFEVSATVNEDLEALKSAIDATKMFVQIKSALPDGYRTAFLMLMGIAALAAAGFGVWASTFVTRRIAALVSTARRVSNGHHDARVELRGNDEMGELGNAFNTMLDDLDETRRHVEYLQRMGVWQDVARRLAHEIKNPLTPIQLAVQQCVSAYKGDDARFGKLLADTGEIVEEEIEGLRRLVDTFRTLGALPKVLAAPLPLASVIEELKLDPTMARRLTLNPPANPVTVRADKLLLKRMLVNLVENGMHAGQEAGTPGEVVIGWSADQHGAFVTITVDDHGKGVADADREKIFEPYVTTKATGTGLGLAISRKLAIEHGGELAVAPDRAPTGGARFVVSLPLGDPDSPAA
ncbi:MAG: histidine kinase [Deltaproteobacteria bacterium]|nr:histidine kinase [Deltaproteobacteria bacterium]